jgi:hypothetical protein
MSFPPSKIAVAIIILAVAVWFAHEQLRESQVASARKKQRSMQKQQLQVAVLVASKQYSAILGWEKQFKGRASDTFSLQLEEALMPNGGNPIALAGFLEDVARRADKYYLYLDDWNVDSLSLRFVLECDVAVAKEIIANKESFFEMEVIAHIDSVEKAQFSIKSGIKTTEHTAPIEIDSSRMFIAHGRCLHIISKE